MADYTHIEHKIKCVDCDHWYQFTEESKKTLAAGYCRLDGPVYEKCFQWGVWPITHSSCWCGKAKERPVIDRSWFKSGKWEGVNRNY